ATGSWSGSKSTSGTASTGALSTTSTYALTCTGLGGTSSASTTVTVTAGVPVVPVSTNPSGVSMPAANAYPGYTQVLADDFTGTSLNQTTWNGFYTDLSQNWLTTHGTVANNEITMSEYKDSANNGVYTGTGLSTRTGWTSGMSFVRARTDGAAGVTMCIGMIGLNTWPPEIDFYEDWPSTNTRQLFTDSIVWGAPATWESTVIRKVNTSVDATQWHTYGVEWNPTTITLLVDGVAWATVPNPSPTGANSFSQPMKLFMQIETGDVGAEPTSITPAVVNMNVDWATVYTPN
ncbi:MAG TPA: glycoside hydrolase family 16 protein, partial [Candidatus Saccharimonadales bacterium]|nr:glycoside hydrolase family 16 protein [Candidatus Saccharimonadales bacterium]